MTDTGYSNKAYCIVIVIAGQADDPGSIAGRVLAFSSSSSPEGGGGGRAASGGYG